MTATVVMTSAALFKKKSVQAPSARIFPKPGKGGQFQSSGREINEERAFTHMEVMAGQMQK